MTRRSLFVSRPVCILRTSCIILREKRESERVFVSLEDKIEKLLNVVNLERFSLNNTNASVGADVM